jgi:hypothetical protein
MEEYYAEEQAAYASKEQEDAILDDIPYEESDPRDEL